MESKAQRKRNKRKTKKAPTAEEEKGEEVVDNPAQTPDAQWSSVNLDEPGPADVPVDDGFVETEITPNHAAQQEYNPFDGAEDIITAPNDGSFHHVPSAEE